MESRRSGRASDSHGWRGFLPLRGPGQTSVTRRLMSRDHRYTEVLHLSEEIRTSQPYQIAGGQEEQKFAHPHNPHHGAGTRVRGGLALYAAHVGW